MNGLGTYVGARLMTNWYVALNVMGAEESSDYEYEQSKDDIPFKEALSKLTEYQNIINENYLDAYLVLEPMRGGHRFEGDLDHILEELFEFGYITREEYDEAYYLE